jgi:hypothetical protein
MYGRVSVLKNINEIDVTYSQLLIKLLSF